MYNVRNHTPEQGFCNKSRSRAVPKAQSARQSIEQSQRLQFNCSACSQGREKGSCHARCKSTNFNPLQPAKSFSKTAPLHPLSYQSILGGHSIQARDHHFDIEDLPWITLTTWPNTSIIPASKQIVMIPVQF